MTTKIGTFLVYLYQMINDDAYPMIRFWNKPTKDLNPTEVTAMYYDLAKETFPQLTKKQWEEGMNGHGGTFADDIARIAWKYSCGRGKSGTPLYTLNGVPYDSPTPTWSYEDWLKVIDPLVQANKPVVSDIDIVQGPMKLYTGALPKLPDRQVVYFSTTERLANVCEKGHRPCELLPGRAMCCQRHEACIFRMGCTTL